MQTQQGQVHVITCTFERTNLDVDIMLNDTSEIVGLTVTPMGTVEQQANATYTVAGHVAEEVVNEIGSWIKQHAKLRPA